MNVAQALLGGTYAALRQFAPPHLASPAEVMALCCDEGIVVHYAKKSTTDPRVKAGWSPQSVKELAFALSGGFIHYIEKGQSPDPALGGGLILEFRSSDSLHGTYQPLFQTTVWAVAYRDGDDLGSRFAKEKPPRLLAFPISIQLVTLGELRPAESTGSTDAVEPFISRTMLDVPFDWNSIEVYAAFAPGDWQADFAAARAEKDLLAAVVTRNVADKGWRAIDPRVDARNQYADLIRRFKELLDSEPEREETLQAFLKQHPQLLCPAFVRCWPKLKLGQGNTGTDFVFLESTGDYLLVEIERSTLRLFRSDGQPTADLTHAQDQVVNWKRYLENNLQTVRNELDLHGISSNPRSLIVMDRSASLGKDDRRKLTTIENQMPKQKIMTYDDVLENAKSVAENILGALVETGSTTELFFLPRGTDVRQVKPLSSPGLLVPVVSPAPVAPPVAQTEEKRGK
jgi:hypothetical protein